MAWVRAGRATARQNRVRGGALIGGGTGTLVGGLPAGTAVTGGVIGAAAGAVIADAMRPGRCYYRTQSGHCRYVRCP